MTAKHYPRDCTVKCDTEGCSAEIYTNRDITEEQAAAAAFALGWDCERRRDRWHHRCAKHSQQ